MSVSIILSNTKKIIIKAPTGPTTTAPAATYDYGYARPPQTYDTSKTYYQQAGTPGYAAPAQPYDTASATSAKVSH